MLFYKKSFIRFLFWLCVLLLIPVGYLFAQASGEMLEPPKPIIWVLTLVAPPLISLIVKYIPKKFHWIIAYALSGATGIIGLLVTGTPITIPSVAIWVPLAFTLSQWSYRLFWHKLHEKITKKN